MVMQFRWILYFVSASVLGFAGATAQEVTADSNSIKAGAWALQFGIGSNFTLTTFQGTTISLQHHLSETNAIRAGITMSGNFTDGTDLFNQFLADTGHIVASSDNANKSTNITLVVQFLWYLNSHSPVHLYVGVGPSVSYSYVNQEASKTAVPPTPYFYYSGYDWNQVNYAYTNKQWGIGARGIAGVEWFAARWFSLHAEYGEGIQYSWSSTRTTTGGVPSSSTLANMSIVDQGSTKGWSITANYVGFGASVYF